MDISFWNGRIWKVARGKQLRLPKLKVERVVEKKYPQPNVTSKRTPRKFEILHYPFNLRFRGRIRRWLDAFDWREGLDEESGKLIALYFFPEGADRRWLNQEEVLEVTGIEYKSKLRRRLVEILVEVWNHTR